MYSDLITTFNAVCGIYLEIKMELIKTLVCCIIVCIITTDVVVARPRHLTDLDTIVRDIDNRLIASEKKSSRRKRRHIQTQQLALMDFCVRYPSRCRHQMEKMQRDRHAQIRFVYVVDK
ncbi:hypothetical protein ACF0H5_020848 [Mactra antiquata]